MRQRLSLTLPLALLLIAAPAWAKKGSHDKIEFDPVAFSEQREQLEDAVHNSDLYRSIDLADKRKVIEALNRMESNLQGVTDLKTLTADKKSAVFNDQELINTVLTKAAADSRMICRREKPVGTRLGTQVCKTVAERRQEMEDARRYMERGQGPTMQAPPGG